MLGLVVAAGSEDCGSSDPIGDVGGKYNASNKGVQFRPFSPCRGDGL